MTRDEEEEILKNVKPLVIEFPKYEHYEAKVADLPMLVQQEQGWKVIKKWLVEEWKIEDIDDHEGGYKEWWRLGSVFLWELGIEITVTAEGVILSSRMARFK